MWYFYKNNWYLKKGQHFFPATHTSNCFGIITKEPVAKKKNQHGGTDNVD